MTHLLTRDEATQLHTRAMQRLTRRLQHLDPAQLTDTLHGNPAHLTTTDMRAYHLYLRTITLITNAGHHDILSDELDGFLSALHASGRDGAADAVRLVA